MSRRHQVRSRSTPNSGVTATDLEVQVKSEVVLPSKHRHPPS